MNIRGWLLCTIGADLCLLVEELFLTQGSIDFKSLQLIKNLHFRWIVTAGHCHDDSFPLAIAVLGEHDVTVETETMIKIVIMANKNSIINQSQSLGEKHCVQNKARGV